MSSNVFAASYKKEYARMLIPILLHYAKKGCRFFHELYLPFICEIILPYPFTFSFLTGIRQTPSLLRIF